MDLGNLKHHAPPNIVNIIIPMRKDLKYKPNLDLPFDGKI